MEQRAIYAATRSEAERRARKLAAKFQIQGNLSLIQKSDSSGGMYWQATWG